MDPKISSPYRSKSEWHDQEFYRAKDLSKQGNVLVQSDAEKEPLWNIHINRFHVINLKVPSKKLNFCTKLCDKTKSWTSGGSAGYPEGFSWGQTRRTSIEMVVVYGLDRPINQRLVGGITNGARGIDSQNARIPESSQTFTRLRPKVHFRTFRQ